MFEDESVMLLGIDDLVVGEFYCFSRFYAHAILNYTGYLDMEKRLYKPVMFLGEKEVSMSLAADFDLNSEPCLVFLYKTEFWYVPLIQREFKLFNWKNNSMEEYKKVDEELTKAWLTKNLMDMPVIKVK